MRRDVVAMGSIAAIAGIALAALLTVAFGARSSGPPAALKPTSVPAAVAAETHAPAKVLRRQADRPRRRVNRRHIPAAAASAQSTGPSRAAATPPATAQTQTTTQPQTVAAPAPTPAPVRPLSRPKPSKPAGGSPGGGSFDDSG
jgi:hypothetical protein